MIDNSEEFHDYMRFIMCGNAEKLALSEMGYTKDEFGNLVECLQDMTIQNLIPMNNGKVPTE